MFDWAFLRWDLRITRHDITIYDQTERPDAHVFEPRQRTIDGRKRKITIRLFIKLNLKRYSYGKRSSEPSGKDDG
jgi:hypothetical protein